MSFGPWGNEATSSISFRGAWITKPDDPEGTLIRLPYGGVGRIHSKERARTALQFVGRPYPVYDVGDARAESFSVATILPGEDEGTPATIALLRRIVGESEIILFRDGRGRKIYAMPTDFTATDLEQRGYDVSFTVNRVDYDEALPEVTETPEELPDQQPKNFNVTVDVASSTVLINWDDVLGAEIYSVYLDGVPVVHTETSLSTYGPLLPGTYSMWVTATVNGVQGPPSETKGFVIEEQADPDPGGGTDPGGGGTTPPSIVPQNFRAFPQTNNSVNFTWNAVPGATSYKMYEVRSPNGVTSGVYTGTSATRGTPTPLSNGPFDYWITATVNGVESAASNHQQFTLPYTGTPIGGGDSSLPADSIYRTVFEEMAYEFASTAENSRKDWYATSVYGYIEDIGDDRGYTAGIVGFCSGTGDMKAMIDHYIVLKPTSNAMSQYVDELTTLASEGEGPTAGSRANTLLGATFRNLWSTLATNDPLFRQAQRDYREEHYWRPAFDQAVADGLGPLGLLVLYDISINHGEGSDSESFGGIVTTAQAAANPPSDGGTQSGYITALIDAREDVLIVWGDNPSNGRVAAHRALVAASKFNLVIPPTLSWSMYGDPFSWTARPELPAEAQRPGNVQPDAPGAGETPGVSAGGDAVVSPGGTFTRTGTVVGSGITAQGWRLVGTGVSGDPGTAAYENSWGTPKTSSDEFNYSGTPDPTRWDLYNGTGHDGNGLRAPARCTVDGSKLVINGLAGSANTGGMAHSENQQYGKWEIRARSYYTTDPTYQGTLKNNSYHPVALIWPTSEDWPADGEYDFMENDGPGQNAVGAFLHYPSLNGSDSQIAVADRTVDMRQFHNYAIEWTSSFIKLYVDGVLWTTASGGGNANRQNIQNMPSGGIRLQLDAFNPSGMQSATMEVDWVRVYPLTPVDTNPSLSSTADVSWTVPTTPGDYTLEFFATNSSGTTTDQVTVTVGSGGGGGGGSLVYPETFDNDTPYTTFKTGTTVVNVSGSSALTSALSAAADGHIITLADGTYTGDFAITSKTGGNNGIVIKAANPLGAVFTSGSSFNINNCTDVSVVGLDFPFDAEGDTLQIRGTSQRCSYMRCRVGPSSFTNSSLTGNYVYVADDVKHFRIGHCTFRNKGTNGNTVRIYGNFTTFQVCQYGRVDHNLFDTVGNEVGNDKESVRYGVSSMSRTDAFGIVERNVFVNILAEPEVVSVKANRIVTRGNTFLRCAGGAVIRHGRNSKQQSNYFIDRANTTATAGLKSGGSRFYDSGHTIEDNYYDGLSSTSGFQRPIILDTGDAPTSSTALSAHWNVIDATVQRNVIKDCVGGIYIGDNYTTAPDSCGIVDNDVIASGGTAVTVVGGNNLTGDSVTTGNVHYATASAGSYAVGSDGIYRKSGRGPKVSYLTQSNVGHAADLTETDRTGVAV